MSYLSDQMEKDYSLTSTRFYQEQNALKKAKDRIGYFSMIGGGLICFSIYVVWGASAAIAFTLGSFVWYILGYMYCEKACEKARQAKDYDEAEEKYKAAHQSEFDEYGFYLYPEEP